MSNTFTNLSRTLYADEVSMQLESRTAGYTVANKDIAEELSFVGQQIRIPVMEGLTAEDTASATYQGLSATGSLLTVDFDKTVAFKVGDREQIQTGQNWVAKGSQEAGRTLRKAWDSHILGKVTEITTYTLDNGATRGYTAAFALDMLDDVAQKMDEMDLPDENRFIVVNAKAKGAIRALLSDRATSWGDVVAENGLVENARGIEVYLSNNTYTPNASSAQFIAGVQGMGLAAIVQVSPDDVEILRDPDANAFGFRVKVRALGGAKVFHESQMISVKYDITS